MDKKYKGILAIDFDDTIVKSKYPQIIGGITGAKKYINALYEKGWYIIIWTCRSDDSNKDKPLTLAKEYLEKYKIKYHKLNEHNDQLVSFYGNDTRKIAADFYIDDKNIFGLPSWKEIYNNLKNLQDFKSCLRYCDGE